MPWVRPHQHTAEKAGNHGRTRPHTLTADENPEEAGEASLAHSGSDVDALKQGVIKKTKQFAEAMKSLETSSKTAMKKDFKEVLKMFKDDLASELGDPVKDEDDEGAKD